MTQSPLYRPAFVLLTIRFSLFGILLLLSMRTVSGQTAASLSLKTTIDKERTAIGSELTIRIVLTNASERVVEDVTVRDSLSTTVTVQPGSATAPTGTTFSAPALPKQTGTWLITRLDPGQTKTLTFRAIVTDVGVVYHTAQVPGTVVKTCATVPVLVCSGDEYAFEITAPDNKGEYSWERTIDGKTSILANQRGSTLLVNAPGAYRTVLAVGQPCPDGACCPFVIEPVPDVPAYSLTGTSPTCSGTAVLVNGNLRLSGPGSTSGLTYQLATGGGSVETGSLLTARPQPIPATGLLSINLTGGLYRVRVFNAAGCFRDGSVTIAPANCNADCPPEKCVPFVVRQTRRAGRLTGPR